MSRNKLKQFYFCHKCEDFFPEWAIVFRNVKSYLTSTLKNLGKCPKGHIRSIDKEDIVFLPEKPNKIINSSIICFDIKGFSEKKPSAQFNNASLLHEACTEILSTHYDYIYKGTGDGFLIGLLSCSVSCAISFCERLVEEYLKYVDINYRIGIEYDAYFSYTDLSGRVDIFGQAVIDATRIADFGYNNHILLSDKAARNFYSTEDRRKTNLIELGYCFDKHRNPYKVFNYKSKIAGNYFAR